MKKQIVAMIMGIALITLASAMYAGECLPVDLGNLTSLDNVVYDVVGNSSNLEGLTINLNGTIANICTVPNYKPDSFTIIFIDDSTKEIIKEVHHYSSGSSSTRKIYIENKTIEYVDVTIPCNETDIIDLTPEDLTPEEKSWLNKFLGWIKNLIKRIF